MLRSLFVFVVIIGCCIACIPEKEVVTEGEITDFSFSKDTIFFDTVFTEIPTYTRLVLLKNNQGNARVIDRIYLEDKQGDTPFLLTINGQKKNSLEKVQLFGGDSIYILIDAEIDPDNSVEPFKTDRLVLEVGNATMGVPIVAYAQDAFYHKNDTLTESSTWTAEKPHIIMGGYFIPEEVTLKVEKSTEILMDYNAFVSVEGTLELNGDTAALIQIQSVRRDGGYDTSPGQWQTIVYQSTSKNNVINGVKMKNGIVGVYAVIFDEDSMPDLTITNTQIDMFSGVGVQSLGTDLVMENVVVSSCGSNLARMIGGNIDIKHCTFSNDLSPFYYDGKETGFTVANNYIGDENTIVGIPLDLKVTNSIISGSLEEELTLALIEEVPFAYSFDHCLLKTGTLKSDPGNNLLNVSPDFVVKSYNAIDTELHPYALDSLSPAIDYCPQIGIENDIIGGKRDSLPDIGAYEFVVGE